MLREDRQFEAPKMDQLKAHKRFGSSASEFNTRVWQPSIADAYTLSHEKTFAIAISKHLQRVFGII